MLVLSRKEGERIFIGNAIEVTVVRITGNKIRLGIETADDIPILRAELRHQKPARLKCSQDLLSSPEERAQDVLPSGKSKEEKGTVSKRKKSVKQVS